MASSEYAFQMTTCMRQCMHLIVRRLHVRSVRAGASYMLRLVSSLFSRAAAEAEMAGGPGAEAGGRGTSGRGALALRGRGRGRKGELAVAGRCGLLSISFPPHLLGLRCQHEQQLMPATAAL